MPAEQWKRVQEIFLAALDQATERRGDFVREACGGDDALRREVEEMLAADAEGSDLLSSGREGVLGSLAAELLPEEEEEAPARRIGPYALLRLLGRGGMGAVYLAEREDVGLRCALKVVRGGTAAPENVQRFLFERRLLARLQHPHIARLLDAGVAEDGTPWFAMELVEGEPIDRYCDTRRLSVRERLRLFEKVCDAVAFAHRNLIVHRDLKPSNILVSRSGEPKLLDFGIAKLLEERDEGLTETGVRVLTPGYAAPEQITGEPVTTATDVYALGLVLYELLSGHRARGPERRTPAAVERWIQGAPPPRPSSVVGRAVPAGEPARGTGARTPVEIAAVRATVPAQLRRRLSGDLDAVVMRALAREPERRYGSAAELLEDLQRHRQGRPVSARPDTWTYRARSFARRNRAAVASASLLVLMLAGFAGSMTVQQAATVRERDRAELEAAKARQVSDFVVALLDVADPFSPVAVRADSITLRDYLVQRGGKVAELEGHPEVQLQAMNLVGRMYLSLGLHAEAEEMLRRALALGRRLHPEGGVPVVASLNALAELQRVTGAWDESERNFREALAMARAVRPTPYEEEVTSLHGLGDLLRQTGSYAESEALLREAVGARRELYGERSAETADGLNNLGLALWAKGDPDGAAPLLEEALAIQRERLPAAHPMTSAVLNNLGLVRMRQGDMPAAEAALRESLEIKRELFGGSHWRIANGVKNLAGVLVELGRLEEADSLAHEALALTRAAFGERHELVGVSLVQLGEIREHQARWAEAERFYRDGIAAHRSTFAGAHPRIVEAEIELGRLLVGRRRSSEALPLLEGAVQFYRARGSSERLRAARAERWLGAALADLGRPGLAEPVLASAVQAFRAAGQLDAGDGREALRLLERLREAGGPPPAQHGTAPRFGRRVRGGRYPATAAPFRIGARNWPV